MAPMALGRGAEIRADLIFDFCILPTSRGTLSPDVLERT